MDVRMYSCTLFNGVLHVHLRVLSTFITNVFLFTDRSCQINGRFDNCTIHVFWLNYSDINVYIRSRLLCLYQIQTALSISDPDCSEEHPGVRRLPCPDAEEDRPCRGLPQIWAEADYRQTGSPSDLLLYRPLGIRWRHTQLPWQLNVIINVYGS